ncbi:MAG: DNA-packaging protein [Eubacterium sp.]
MVESQLIKLKKRINPEDLPKTDSILEAHLEDAKWTIQNRRFPCGDFPEDLESQYLNLQIRIALEMFNKEGAEGQTGHSENGTNRSYETAGVSNSLLSEILPRVSVIERS